jgi:hypothetical protein
MTITPRSRFQEDKPRASKHRDFVVSSQYLTAADAALLQVINEMADSVDPATAIAGYHRIMGARKFMEAFANLAEQPRLTPSKENFNLNHALK